MGNPKKPASHHHAMGNFRPSVHGGPVLPVESPPMPPDMSPVAQACWNLVSEHVRFAGVVAVVDWLALRVLCETYALYREAEDDVRTRGIVVENMTKNGLSIRKNPAISVLENARKDLANLCHRFGLTPAGRTGLKVGGQTSNVSEEERVGAILKLHG